MTQFDDLLNNNENLLVDFFATWCGPCKMMHPVIEDLKDKLSGKVAVIQIDVDKEPELSDKYGIQAVPTLIFFNNGKAEWRQAGVHTATDIMQAIQKFL